MSSRFDVLATPLEGLKVIRRKPLGDARGYLERMFCSEELQSLTSGKHIVQINRTLTARRGTVRGMHYQRPPHSEIKFVSCLRGQIFDVAVDLRRGSSTFLHWHAEVLSEDNRMTMVVPEGFAHGFQVLSDASELVYLHTAAYCAEDEGGLHPQDPLLAIQWPEEIAQLSSRDSSHPALRSDFAGLLT